MTSTEHEPTSETLPPVTCTPWCEKGDGHINVGFVDDQWCSSISFPVVLSLEEAAPYGDGTIRPAQANVYASRDARQPPFVAWVNQNDASTNMTPQEAREAARTLVHAAWVAEKSA